MVTRVKAHPLSNVPGLALGLLLGAAFYSLFIVPALLNGTYVMQIDGDNFVRTLGFGAAFMLIGAAPVLATAGVCDWVRKHHPRHENLVAMVVFGTLAAAFIAIAVTAFHDGNVRAQEMNELRALYGF